MASVSVGCLVACSWILCKFILSLFMPLDAPMGSHVEVEPSPQVPWRNVRIMPCTDEPAEGLVVVGSFVNTYEWPIRRVCIAIDVVAIINALTLSIVGIDVNVAFANPWLPFISAVEITKGTKVNCCEISTCSHRVARMSILWREQYVCESLFHQGMLCVHHLSPWLDYVPDLSYFCVEVVCSYPLVLWLFGFDS